VPRVVRGAKHTRRRKILDRAEGYWGARHRCYQVAREAVRRAEEYMTRDRHDRKRDMRRLWITRVNAACRERGMTYSRFIAVVRKAGVELNRKILSELAIHDPAAFDELVRSASEAAAAGA